MTYVNPTDVYRTDDLKKLIEFGGTIQKSITIRGSYIKIFTGVEKIVGSLGASDSKLESFGSLKEITGDIWFSIHHVYPSFNDLGNLEIVSGNFSLKDIKIKSLGKLRRVGGNLNLRNTPIEDLGDLEFVGGGLSLPKRLQGEIDLSRIKIVGRVSYHKEYDNRLENLPQNQPSLIVSEIPVPYWEKVYAYSIAFLDSAEARQKEFYDYFKQNFLDGKTIDVMGNNNYVFALMFDLIEDFRLHRDQDLVVRQLSALETDYPVVKSYTEENLADAIKGKTNNRSTGELGVSITFDADEIFDELLKEHPELLEKLNDESDDDEVFADFDEDFEETDDNDERFTEKYKFPPAAPIYTVQLTETRDENNQCLETAVLVNEKFVRLLKARVNSIRADVAADRLFVQTLYSESDDSFSIFCFEFSTNRLLWQTRDVPPGGVLFLDLERRRIEAGVTYGCDDDYIVLLDYEGNILERNFRDGYEMIEAAEKLLKNEEYQKSEELFLRSLETAISLNTKLKAAKKLARIGKLTDDALFSGYTKLAADFETEKQAEKERESERSAREKLPLSQRLQRGGKAESETAEMPEDSVQHKIFWDKRWKQIEEDGGS